MTDLEEINEHTTPSIHRPKFQNWALENAKIN